MAPQEELPPSLPSPFLKSHYAFIKIIITNIAPDRINFLGFGFTVQYGLNVAYFLTPTPTPTSPPSPSQCLAMSLREIKRAWKVEQEIEKRGPVALRRPRCLPLFPLHMGLLRRTPCCRCTSAPFLIILTVLVGDILLRARGAVLSCGAALQHQEATRSPAVWKYFTGDAMTAGWHAQLATCSAWANRLSKWFRAAPAFNSSPSERVLGYPQEWNVFFYFAFIFAIWFHWDFRVELLNTDALRGSIHFLSLPPVLQRDLI